MNNAFQIRLHPLFLLVLAASLWFGFLLECLLSFAVVIVHECGHLFAANMMGWKVRELHLLPFGGELVVEHRRLPRVREECVVALAGPLVNLLFMILSWSCYQLGFLSGEWHHYILEINIWIAIFNLIPVLPLDGGKLVLALLTLICSYRKAHLVMIHTSIGLGGLMLLASAGQLNMSGIRFDILMVSLFIMYVNVLSLRLVPLTMTRFWLQKLALFESDTTFKIKDTFVYESDPAQRALQRLMRSRVHRFFILNRTGRVTRVLSERALLTKYFSTDFERR